MAYRIATTRASRSAGVLAALSAALFVLSPARAQGPAPVAAPVSKTCAPGSAASAEETPLPNVAAALAQRKQLRILAMGAAPGRVTAQGGGYTALIESMLTQSLTGIDVVMINRGVSGELAANATTRMKNEVALDDPDLVLWQVGTNDALAYVPAREFAATVKDQIAWLRAHKVDVVLVGLQFVNQMLREEHYVKIRETLRNVAAQEGVIVIRFYEATQILEQAASASRDVGVEFDRNEANYNCLAQYVARAITLGVFAKNMPARPVPQKP